MLAIYWGPNGIESGCINGQNMCREKFACFCFKWNCCYEYLLPMSSFSRALTSYSMISLCAPPRWWSRPPKKKWNNISSPCVWNLVFWCFMTISEGCSVDGAANRTFFLPAQLLPLSSFLITRKQSLRPQHSRPDSSDTFRSQICFRLRYEMIFDRATAEERLFCIQTLNLTTAETLQEST